MNGIKDLQNEIDRFSKERDWDQFHSPENLAKSISIEAGELLECFQWKNLEQVDEMINSKKSVEIEEEMADILILLLNMADVTGINLIHAANAKLEKNDKKYPVEKSKGNAKKYTEFEKE